MSVLLQRAIIWLILLTVPVQGAAAAMAVLQGPAHYHLAMQTSRQHETSHAHAAHHSHGPQHRHDQVRRHYHLPGDGAVLVQDDHQHDNAAVQARTAKGESVSAAFVALISASPAFHLPDRVNDIAIGKPKKLLSCIPRRIERPPRLLLA